MSTELPGLLTNLTAASTVLSPDRSRSLTFDREGRLLFYFRQGRTYKRSLASELHLRFRSAVRQRRRLSDEKALEIFSEVHETARQIHAAAVGEVQRRLEREILPWEPTRLAAERERFERTYRPIAILPPDQYLAVVLQATEGCSWNACTFCNFYMDRPFQVRNVDAFTQHAREVHALLGRGLALRRGVFLADGNALALSNRRLQPLLRVAHEVFPGRKLYGFVDLYTGERRSIQDWRALGELGLERVYVGMETGLDELLRFINKPGSAVELAEFVRLLKAAGLQVGLIVMVGLGGREFLHPHREATERVLLRLPLNRHDLIYLSPFVEHPSSEYQQRRIAGGLTPMSELEIERELVGIATGLRAAGLRASRYDIREFIY
jgi:radical SAM superfamily enzyme YgiQ (UPF0313 family)